jgi:hypothetical protein
MDKLTLQNPVFAAYAIAASIMILKAVAMSWLTVFRMMRARRDVAELIGRREASARRAAARLGVKGLRERA